MKYVILHGEGLADQPYPELGGKTPLQAAATPNMDHLARAGELGLVAAPSNGPLGPHEATALGLLGCDPRKFQTGPAPFEAAGLGVALGDQDVAFRCHIVTLKPQGGHGKGGGASQEWKKLSPQIMMDDETPGDITTEEARELIDAVNEQLGSETIQFYPGTGHRHFMVWVGGKARATCVNPHDVVGKAIGEYLPSGEGADILRKLMEASLIILGTHPVNDQRIEDGHKPANCLWLWGQGKAPKLPKVQERFQVDGVVLSSSDLVRGMGVCAGLESVSPEEFAGSGEAGLSTQTERALRELEKRDFLYLHAELPCPLSTEMNAKEKCELLELFDQRVVGAVVERLKKTGPYRLLLIGERRPVAKPADNTLTALYALVNGNGQSPGTGKRGFNEVDAEAAQAGVRDATKLAAKLFARGSGDAG